MYGELLSRPVSIPLPVFLSFGIPPASIPASCGGPDDPAPPLPSPAPSLLLRARLRAGGARLPGVGRLGMPGTGGAPAIGAAGAPSFLSSIGADRSFTTPTFFSRVPASMLLRSAPWNPLVAFLLPRGRTLNDGCLKWNDKWVYERCTNSSSASRTSS